MGLAETADTLTLIAGIGVSDGHAERAVTLSFYLDD